MSYSFKKLINESLQRSRAWNEGLGLQAYFPPASQIQEGDEKPSLTKNPMGHKVDFHVKKVFQKLVKLWVEE